MIHLYYGDGKGKTTAATGLALRALGAGRRVCVVQFLKDGTSGEAAMLAGMPGVTVLHDGAAAKFTFLMSAEERVASRKLHDANLRRAIDLVRTGDCQMLVLDEAVDAANAGLVGEALLREAVMLGEGSTAEAGSCARPANDRLDPDCGGTTESADGVSIPDVEVVVTGHAPYVQADRAETADAAPGSPFFSWILDHADYVTEMRCVRHPYDRGVPARRGVEY